jgi:RNA recognition motif-containing protein
MEHGDSHYTPNFMENTDSHYAVEKGAYITGDGDHYDWHRVNNKGTREVKWSKKSCLVLRGLPFSASECDVADFLERCGVLGSLAPGRPIILLVNPQGRPSGFAEVNMVGEVEAEEARPAIHMQRLGGRYIEVLPNAPSKSDYKWANAGDCDTSSSIATVAQPRRGRGGQSSKSTYESIKSSSSRRVGRAAGYGFGKNAMYDQSSWNGSWRR